MVGDLTSPSQAAVRAETFDQVEQAIAAMDPLDQEVLALRHFEELGNSEVAEVLGIQQKAASIRYVRALKRLRAILSRDARPARGRPTMSEADADRDPLEVLAAEFIERQRRGESPSVAEYAARHPDLAAEIEELFPTIAAMERLKVHKQQGSGARVLAGRGAAGAAGRFPHPRRDRPRRHGHRLRGLPGIARPARRREGAAPAVAA